MDFMCFSIFMVGAISLAFCIGIPFGYFFKTYNDKQQKWIKRKLKEFNDINE